MRKTDYRLDWARLLTGFICAAPVAAQTATASTDASSTLAPTQLEEVVVTASKRAETVQNVPGGITALTGATLSNLGIVDFSDYLPYVPGLAANSGSSTAGVPGSYAVILRGLNSGANQSTATTGYYLGDTPLTPSSAGAPSGLYAPDPDLGDVERVEVLKGPQATLYGASTLGGLIKIVYKKPDFTNFGGDLSVGGTTITDGGTGYSTRGAVNLPLVQGTLAARISAYDREDPGFTDNVFTGSTHANSDHAHGGRLNLRYEPIEQLDIELSALIQNLHSGGNTVEFLDSHTLLPIYGANRYSAFFNTQTNNQLNVYSLSATYDAGIGSLVNSLSYAHVAEHYENGDLADEFDPLLGLPGVALEGDHYHAISKKVTDELRFTSNRLGRFVWQLGLFYTHEDIDFGADLEAKTYPGGALLPGPLNPFLVALTTATYQEEAAFGDLTYYLTDTVDATLGARYSHNQQDAVELTGGFAAELGGTAGTVVNHFAASDESYLFNLRWRPTEQLSLYARAASAYRPGGPQTISGPGVPTTFGPDTDWDYEVGAKGRWLGGRLSTNLDVYYIDWRKIQLNTTYNGFLLITNGGDAKSEGVEFDGSYELFQGFIVGANASFDETAIRSVDPNNTAGARVGDPLPYTPRWSGALTADYSFPLTADVRVGAGGSWTYRGARYSSFSADPLNTRERLPSYSLIGLRSHVDWSRYRLTLNINNVANKQTYADLAFARLAPGEPVPAYATPIQPRTFRLTLDVRF